MPKISKKRVMWIWASAADGARGSKPSGVANGALELGQHAGLVQGSGIQGLELSTVEEISNEESASSIYTGTKRRAFSATIYEEAPTSSLGGTLWLLDLTGVTDALVSVEDGPSGMASGERKLEYQAKVSRIRPVAGEVRSFTIEGTVQGAPTVGSY